MKALKYTHARGYAKKKKKKKRITKESNTSTHSKNSEWNTSLSSSNVKHATMCVLGIRNVYIYLGSESVSLLKRKEKLWNRRYRHCCYTRLLPSNRKKILLNFQLVTPSPAVRLKLSFILFFFSSPPLRPTLPLSRFSEPKVAFETFPIGHRVLFSGRVLLTVSNDLASLSGPIIDRLGMRLGHAF